MTIKIPATSEEATEQAQKVIQLFTPDDFNLAAKHEEELSALVASMYLDMLMQADKVKVIKTMKVCIATAYLLGLKGKPKKKRRRK